MKNKKELKALGFIEVIIAIVIVGISSAVFLTMAGRAMKNLVQSERIEYMKRVAKDGVNIAEEVAHLQKSAKVNEEYFPMKSGDVGNCFIPVKEGVGENVTYSFASDGSGFLSIPYSAPEIARAWALESNRAIYKSLDLDDDTYYNTDYFLLMCIESIDTTGSQWANVYFWVGDIHVEGKITSERDMKDFKYNAIIDL